MQINDGFHRSAFGNSFVEPDSNLTALFLRRYLDFASEDTYLSKGDPNIEIDNYVLDEAGSELGFFALAILGCVFILLN
jgi:hypothetical protein